MEQKRLVMTGMILGGIVGGYIPTLWNAGILSMSSVVFSALGGFLGIYIGFKLGE